MTDRDRSRKAIFDGFAEAYHAARPGYPDELVDEICARVPAGGRILV